MNLLSLNIIKRLQSSFLQALKLAETILRVKKIQILCEA